MTKKETLGIIQGMSQRAIKGMGAWSFARFCRNNGVQFLTCYYLMFNRLPRR